MTDKELTTAIPLISSGVFSVTHDSNQLICHPDFHCDQCPFKDYPDCNFPLTSKQLADLHSDYPEIFI